MKLRNKLILSCAALAAVATTAVSTTYAWYTNNAEVTAKGVTGTTESQDQSVLMISKDDYNWGSKVQLDLASLKLVPVAHVAEDTFEQVTTTAGETVVTGLYERTGDEGEYEYTKITAADTKAVAGKVYGKYQQAGFYAWDQESNEATVTTTENIEYFAFDLYFKSGTTDSLNVFMKKFDLVNTSADALDPKIKLNNIGLPVANTTYTVNMFRALTIEQVAGNTTELLTAPSNDNRPAAPEDTTFVAWDCQSLVAADTDSLTSGYNAHKYYNAVKGLYEDTYTAANNYVDNPDYDSSNPASEPKILQPLASFAANTKYCTYDSTAREYVELTAEQITAGPQAGVQYFIKTTEVSGIDEERTNSIEDNRASLKDTSAQNYDMTTWQLGVTGEGSDDDDVASSVLKVTFIIYLDGWDLACFDACQGQSFTLDMEFTSTKA